MEKIVLVSEKRIFQSKGTESTFYELFVDNFDKTRTVKFNGFVGYNTDLIITHVFISNRHIFSYR